MVSTNQGYPLRQQGCIPMTRPTTESKHPASIKGAVCYLRSGRCSACQMLYLISVGIDSCRDNYLMGVQCLARSLKAAASRFPLVVLYTPDTLSSSACAALQQEGCQLAPVERYHPAGDECHELLGTARAGYAELFDCW